MEEKRRPGRPPAEKGGAEETRRMILHHAMVLLNEHGYTAVSMSDVAQRAGVTKATLYYHFPGKAELMMSGMLFQSEQIRQSIENIVQQNHLTVRERLTRLIEAMAQSQERTGYNSMMVQEAIAHLTPEQQAQQWNALQALAHPLRELMAEGVKRGELRPLAPEILVLIFQRLFQPVDKEQLTRYGEESYTQLYKKLMDVFFQGAGI